MAHPARIIGTAAGVILAGASFSLHPGPHHTASCAQGHGSVTTTNQVSSDSTVAAPSNATFNALAGASSGDVTMAGRRSISADGRATAGSTPSTAEASSPSSGMAWSTLGAPQTASTATDGSLAPSVGSATTPHPPTSAQVAGQADVGVSASGVGAHTAAHASDDAAVTAG